MGILKRRDDAEREEMKRRGSSRLVALSVLAVSVILLVAAVAFVFWKPEVIFDVDHGAVESSVADELPERLFVAPCKPRDGAWRCTVAAGEGSDSVMAYRLTVRVDDDRCWTVTKAPGRSLAEAEGCIGLTDYLFEEEAFLN